MSTSRVEKLNVGEVTVFDLDGIRIHSYDTKDPLDDQAIIIENIETRDAFAIEHPGSDESITELTEYIRMNGIRLAAQLLAYHGGGNRFMPNVEKMMTQGALDFTNIGAGRAMVEKFSRTFGKTFDDGPCTADTIIGGGPLEIAGIHVIINPDQEAYEIEIPTARAAYVHMIGHDCHSIVGGPDHADIIISNLQRYLDRGYELFLTSHYRPETREDVMTKIAYISRLRDIASGSRSSDEFIGTMISEFPDYSGKNYLEMTADAFFPQQPLW